MADDISLETDLLRPYFRKFEHSDDEVEISVRLRSSPDRMAFEVSVKIKEPTYEGAYPQRRFALERHDGAGHEGIHLQVYVHPVDIGERFSRLYITLDIKNDQELVELSEGFVFTLYEIIQSLGPGFDLVAGEIFNTTLVETLASKKDLLMTRVLESFKARNIEIRTADRSKTILLKGEQILRLLEHRAEVRPKLGPIADTVTDRD